VGGVVKRPQAISQPQPDYPPLAKIARVQGVVDIDAVIDEHGNVVKAHVMDGPALLIDAALKAVSQWKYQPTYLNGQPYPIDLTIQVTFSLS
jgi:protein TonB